MNFYRFLFPVLGFLMITSAPLRAGADGDPVEELSATVSEVLDILFPEGVAEDPMSVMPQVRAVVEDRFDFDIIARRSLGRGWNRLSEAQREHFSDLFADLLMYSYTDRLAGLSRPRVEWGTSRPLGSNRLEVPSTILYQGERYEVIYRLAQVEGDWQVYDLVIEGVSLVGNYRSQFTSVLDRRGPDELIRVLGQRVEAQKENSNG